MRNIWTKIKDFFYGIQVLLHKVFGRKKPAEGVALTLLAQKRAARRSELIFVWGSLSVPLINFCIFFFYVNFFSIDLAFRHNRLDGTYYHDFYNFKIVFDEFMNPYSLIRESLVNTLKYFFVNFVFMLPLSYIVSYFIYKKIWLHDAFRYIFFIPHIVSAVILASFFKYMVEPNGIITLIVEKLCGEKILLLANSKTALRTLIIYGMWGGLGMNVIYFTANLNRIPIEVIESAKLEGVNTWQEIRYLLFPLTWPFFSTFMFLRLTGIFSAGGAALLLTNGAYGTYDFPFWQYVYVTDGDSAKQYVTAALGWIITLVTMPISLTFKHLADKVEPVEF